MTLQQLIEPTLSKHEELFAKIAALTGGRFEQLSSLEFVTTEHVCDIFQRKQPYPNIKNRFGPIIDDAWNYQTDLSTPSALRTYFEKGGREAFRLLAAQIEAFWGRRCGCSDGARGEIEDPEEFMILLMYVLGLDQRVVVDEALRLAHNRFVMDAECENENDCVYCAELE